MTEFLITEIPSVDFDKTSAWMQVRVLPESTDKPTQTIKETRKRILISSLSQARWTC